MNQDKAMRARVAGREATEERTVWKLDVPPLRYRCLRDEKLNPNGTPRFTVEIRDADGKWGKVFESNNARNALALVTTSNTVTMILK